MLEKEKISLFVTNDDIVTGLKEVLADFKEWDCEYQRNITPKTFDAFVDFMRGLPDSLTCEYYYDKQREYLSSKIDTTSLSDNEVELIYFEEVYNTLTSGLHEFHLGFWR